MDSFLTKVYDRMVEHLRNGTTDLADEPLHVPIVNFTTREHLERELAVFRRQKIVAAMSSELPAPGAFVTRDILGVPLLIVRDKAGSVAAFRNMCRHRGGKVEFEEKGSKPFFVCSYHGWSYDSSGALRGVPFEDQLGGIDRTCNSLLRVASEERHGIVWIDFSGEGGGSVAEYLGEADARLAGYEVEKTTVFMEKWIPLNINWKIVMDGAIDVLHPQFLHPQGVGKLIHTSSAVWLDYGRHGQSFSARKRLVEKLRNGEEIATGWRYISGNLMVFPNTCLIPTPDHYEYWTVWPDLQDPGKSMVHIRFLTDPAKLDETVAARINRSWEILEQAATEEDFPMEETIQANATALPSGSFLYGRNEAPCQHLHRQLAREFKALSV